MALSYARGFARQLPTGRFSLLRKFPTLPTGIEFHSKLIPSASKIGASPIINVAMEDVYGESRLRRRFLIPFSAVSD